MRPATKPTRRLRRQCDREGGSRDPLQIARHRLPAPGASRELRDRSRATPSITKAAESEPARPRRG